MIRQTVMQKNRIKALYQDWASLKQVTGFMAFSRNVSHSSTKVWKELASLKRLVLQNYRRQWEQTYIDHLNPRISLPCVTSLSVLWWPVQWAFVAFLVTWNKYDDDDDDDAGCSEFGCRPASRAAAEMYESANGQITVTSLAVLPGNEGKSIGAFPVGTR